MRADKSFGMNSVAASEVSFRTYLNPDAMIRRKNIRCPVPGLNSAFWVIGLLGYMEWDEVDFPIMDRSETSPKSCERLVHFPF